MSTIVLGKIAGRITVLLVRNDVFNAVLRRQVAGEPSAWPADTSLRVGDLTFPLILSADGTVGAITIPAQIVNEIYDGESRIAELNVSEIETYKGSVVFS